MEQKDYLMREIEKIGVLLRAILGRLLNRNDDVSVEVQNPFAQTCELLIDEIDFHLDTFLALDKQATKEYLSGFAGIRAENLELLAEIVYQFGISDPQGHNRIYLEKALQLFELSIQTDRTFSAVRESKINAIKSLLL